MCRLKPAPTQKASYGGHAIVLPFAVADAGAVERAADQVEKEFGSIDIRVNNAMLSVFAPVMETKPGEYKRVGRPGYAPAATRRVKFATSTGS